MWKILLSFEALIYQYINTDPPETQLWRFFLCSGHSLLVNFFETLHVTVVRLDVLYRAHSWLQRDTKCLEVSP